ncbi:MAG TPA: alpha/beta fold hydrolase, partial [Gaiellales bacterium]|nr:alpha/beta fold hydrolase [Gaiellales bacterium]
MTKLVSLGDGRRASYEIVGEGEPLLMFMGGPGLPARLIWKDAELLAGRFASYLIDPHGSGESSPPADPGAYDHLGHARFYDEVRRALGLGRVSVHGLSFGGTVALTYAALFPEETIRC